MAERTTSAEDTQNQHCQCVHTNVDIMGDAAYPVCILRSLPLLPHLQLLLVLFQLLLDCFGGLAHPCSRLLPPSDRVFGVDLGMPMPADAFALQPHPDLSRVGCRSHTRVDESWSSVITRSQPEHAQVRCSPGMAMIFTTHFILELASDVNSCTKYRSCAACASYSSHRNSVWSLSFFLHLLFQSL